MADHQEQQACEANTDNSQALPVGSARQTNSNPIEDILKHIEKQTTMNHTYTYKEHFKNVQSGTCTSDTQQESMTTNPRDNIS